MTDRTARTAYEQWKQTLPSIGYPLQDAFEAGYEAGMRAAGRIDAQWGEVFHGSGESGMREIVPEIPERRKEPRWDGGWNRY